MRQADKLQDHIVDDSGHNLDKTVINVLNEIAHEPKNEESKRDDVTERIESFFDLPEDL